MIGWNLRPLLTSQISGLLSLMSKVTVSQGCCNWMWQLVLNIWMENDIQEQQWMRKLSLNKNFNDRLLSGFRRLGIQCAYLMDLFYHTYRQCFRSLSTLDRCGHYMLFFFKYVCLYPRNNTLVWNDMRVHKHKFMQKCTMEKHFYIISKGTHSPACTSTNPIALPSWQETVLFCVDPELFSGDTVSLESVEFSRFSMTRIQCSLHFDPSFTHNSKTLLQVLKTKKDREGVIILSEFNFKRANISSELNSYMRQFYYI